MPRERAIVNRIMAVVRSLGCHVEKTHGSVYGEKGRPDLYIWVPVRYQRVAVPLVVEVKQPGEVPTKLQAYRLAIFARHHVETLYATTPEQVRERIERIQKGEHSE